MTPERLNEAEKRQWERIHTATRTGDGGPFACGILYPAESESHLLEISLLRAECEAQAARIAELGQLLKEAHAACRRQKEKWRQTFRLKYANHFAAERDKNARRITELESALAAAKSELREYRRAIGNSGRNYVQECDDALAAKDKVIAELRADYDQLVSLVERRGFVVRQQNGLEVRLANDDLAARRNELDAAQRRIEELEAENTALRKVLDGAIVDYEKCPYQMATDEIERLKLVHVVEIPGFFYMLDKQAVQDVALREPQE